jgi:hypothetical protein
MPRRICDPEEISVAQPEHAGSIRRCAKPNTTGGQENTVVMGLGAAPASEAVQPLAATHSIMSPVAVNGL